MSIGYLYGLFYIVDSIFCSVLLYVCAGRCIRFFFGENDQDECIQWHHVVRVWLLNFPECKHISLSHCFPQRIKQLKINILIHEEKWIVG